MLRAALPVSRELRNRRVSDPKAGVFVNLCVPELIKIVTYIRESTEHHYTQKKFRSKLKKFTGSVIFGMSEGLRDCVEGTGSFTGIFIYTPGRIFPGYTHLLGEAGVKVSIIYTGSE